MLETLFRGCKQSRLSCQSLLGHLGHMTAPTQLRSFDSEEKWLNIQDFTNLVATHFVAKFQKVNSSHKN